MNEQIRPSRDTCGSGPAGLGDPLAPAAAPGVATVGSGPHSEDLPVAGMTVGEVRRRLQSRFDIDPAAQAYVAASPVGDDTVIRAGQVLTFARKGGEKGV